MSTAPDKGDGAALLLDEDVAADGESAASRYEWAFIGVIRVALDCADVCEATARRRDAGDGSRRDR